MVRIFSKSDDARVFANRAVWTARRDWQIARVQTKNLAICERASYGIRDVRIARLYQIAGECERQGDLDEPG